MTEEDDELPEAEEGVLVEKGGFKVDRARALELLAQYRSPEAGPLMFLARAAAAAGASRLRVAWKGPELAVDFDGEPYSRAELADPYGAFFEEGSRPPAKFLAQGLIHAFRPGLIELTVVSGAPGAAFELKTSGTASETVEPAERSHAGTTVRLLCSRRDDRLLSHPVPASEIACRPQSHFWGRLPSEFSSDGAIEGSYAPREAGPGELLDAPSDGPRILLSFLPPPESVGLLDLYFHGVYAGRLKAAVSCPDVLAKVDDADLSLNASHTALVRSPRVTVLKDRCRVLAWDLVGKVATEQEERLPATASLLRSDARARELWRLRFTRGADAELDLHERGPLSPQDESVLHDAAASAWLRSIAVQFADKIPLRVRDAITRAPLFLSGEYKPLSAADLRRAGKSVKSAGRPGGGPREAWCETAHQATLLRRLR